MVSSKVYPSLDRKPGDSNWVDKAGGLPDYIERIAKHLHYEQGMSISHAIASAVNQVKKWAAGLGGVSAATKAKAAAAVAEWEAKKHVHLSVVARQFDESKVKRVEHGKFGNKITSGQYNSAHRIVEEAVSTLQIGQSVSFPGGAGWVQRTASGYVVQGDAGTRVIVRTASEAVQAAATILAQKVQG